MPTLHELQDRFAASVIGGTPSGIEAAIAPDAPGAAARVEIYANHFRITLIGALAANFPVVHQLVGDGFFRTAARRYIRSEPPVEPCLFAYGGGFPAFLQVLPEARSLPYLADVARLEWAISEALYAPESLPDETSLGLHPSCRLVSSPYPVDQIWQAHQGCGTEIGTVDLDAGAVRLLVSRQDDEVGWIHLPPADFAFLNGLMAQAAGQDALAQARALNAAFEPVSLLAGLIEAGLISSPVSNSIA